MQRAFSFLARSSERSLRAFASPLAGAARGMSTSAAKRPEVVLVTGANGQIGVELVRYMRDRYGAGRVVATDVRPPPADESAASSSQEGPFRYLDVTDAEAMNHLIVEHRVTTIVHLASLLSAVGERNPHVAMRVNVRGSENALEAARVHGCKVFIPSTIAVFGASTPRDMTPNETIMRPGTIYGVSKVYMELLGEYYTRKFGVDFRSVRYPGIISHGAEPGGGTTDYAVDIFYRALRDGRYDCFLRSDSALPMMYMPDCLAGTVQLMEAPAARLSTRVYNLTAMSFTPAQLADALRAFLPAFDMRYAAGADPRQAIADSWPRSIDDAPARRDWGWAPRYDLHDMCGDMLRNLAPKLGVPYAPPRGAK